MISQETVDQLNQLSMEMILFAGNAREKIMTALELLADKNFEEANRLVCVAKHEIDEAHILQTQTVQREASGEEYYYSMLFTHAQDTLMTVQSEYNIAVHLIKILEKL